MHRSRFPHLLSTLLALAAGAVLRLWFIHSFRQVQGDSLLYGDLAANWLAHGVYGFSTRSAQGFPSIAPTLIRLPEYPAFLALSFKFFGLANYHAVLLLQAAIDLCDCLLIAGFVRRVSSARAGRIALWLAALCPFTANYTAAPLTETLSIFCVSLGLYALIRLLDSYEWRWVFVSVFAWSYGALLRPDGALLAAVLFFALIVYRRQVWGWAPTLRRALACAALALLPFVPWTVRNWRTFHVFQPLAPRSAADPGEFATPGFDRWTKTWAADFASTYEICWSVPGDDIDIAALPSRAFDNPRQYEETRHLFDRYNGESNRGYTITPEMDAEFARLAAARIRAHPARFYLTLPLLRLADMWLRPRVEMLNIELRWWRYSRHRAETRFTIAYGALNLAYLIAALAGAICWPKFRGMMLSYLLARSLVLLIAVVAPEPRYTLECFPIIIAFAAQGADRLARLPWSILLGIVNDYI